MVGIESKHERFRRLAESRGERLRREIRLIGNLSNTKNYEYTANDVEKLFTPIEDEICEAKEQFERNVLKMKEQND